MNMAISRNMLSPDSSMVSINDLSKKYGKFPAITDVSLAIAENETLAVLGPSGCGKTTLLRLIAGLETPDQGEILLAGDVMSSPAKVVAPYKRSIGMVFQDLALWPHMTVAQHIDFALSKTGSRGERKEFVAEILARIRLQKPERYPRELSGGEQQRLAIGRALAGRPKLLLMDEPLSSLDPQLKEELLLELRLLIGLGDVTTIYVTHQWREAMALADRIAVMAAGRIVRMGPKEEFAANREYIRQLQPEFIQ
jgi:iron(III) transport system ATP-binding protein